ncbi:transposase [Escherichia coli]|nr:transposase [Escherichia coli]EFE0685331.1 transposase [Escherichia coli]EFF2115214.1 transposase [Escherichia coli]EFK1952791.1 transposase [Escherichia coli]EFK2869979.1 transposase [Escherichia coli]
MQPGKPKLNALIEHFNRTYCTKTFNFHLFRMLY